MNMMVVLTMEGLSIVDHVYNFRYLGGAETGGSWFRPAQTKSY
jgi:hypothetical protein